VITTGSLPLDAVVVGIALLAGYLAGSIPLTRLVARATGRAPLAEGMPGPGSGALWKEAGPGWGMLALTGDLAKGVVPVAVGIVTWSWGIGWVAGLGALLGACWPAFGRYPGDRGVAVLCGVAFTLAPPSGVVSGLLAVLVLAAGRLLGRNALLPALATGIGAFPLLFLAVQQDIARLGALLVLYLVAGLRHVTTHDR
jgi:glycerol-3-phosphate acyltransferase PlsY